MAFLAYECKHFFCRKNLIVFLLFLILSLYLVFDGVNQYQDIIENKARFQEFEKVKVAHYINYTQYGIYGFRLLFIPSPLSVFFTNSGLIDELIANIDSSDVLRIYYSLQGKSLYADKAGGYKDFSGIILLFGTLLVLYFGYDAFRHKEYLKFLSGFSSYKQVFFFIQLSRILLLMLFFTVVFGLALLLLLVEGIPLNGLEFTNLLYYWLVLFLLVAFLFVLGGMAGTVRSHFTGIVLVLVIWFAFVFFIPGVVNQLVAKRADQITSNYHIEFEKLKLVMEFEKKALDQAKRYTRLEEKVKSERTLVESFWNNEFKKIQALENTMKTEMSDNYHYFRNLSVLFPSTFYLSVSHEVSSRGYENYFKFYQHILRLKEGFVRYYIKKKFYANYSHVESFIKGDENLFYAGSGLPGNFGLGGAVTLFYIMLACIASYIRFKNYLFYVPDHRLTEIKKLNVALKTGRAEVVLTGTKSINNQFFNVFHGEAGTFKGKLMVDDVNIAEVTHRPDGHFLYICHPEEIPENIKTGHLLSLFQDLLKLSKKEKAELYVQLNIDDLEKTLFKDLDEVSQGTLLLTVAQWKKSKVYMLDDFARGMPADFIMKLMECLRKLKENNSAILYITTDILVAKKVGDSVTSLFDDPNLHNQLKTYRSLKEDTGPYPMNSSVLQ